MKTAVKICGVTTSADACLAADAGADYVGVIVDIAGSRRSVSTALAAGICRDCPVPVVLVMEGAPQIPADLAPWAIQLIGGQSPDTVAALKQVLGCRLWKTISVPTIGSGQKLSGLQRAIQQYCRAGIDTIVLDTLVQGRKGGTGIPCDWETARMVVSDCPRPVFLAGGITPANVAAAILQVRPAGIDTSSGIESAPGSKDPGLVHALVQAVQRIRSSDQPHTITGR